MNTTQGVGPVGRVVKLTISSILRRVANVLVGMAENAHDTQQCWPVLDKCGSGWEMSGFNAIQKPGFTVVACQH
jgi:hypothetical protein